MWRTSAAHFVRDAHILCRIRNARSYGPSHHALDCTMMMMMKNWHKAENEQWDAASQCIPNCIHVLNPQVVRTKYSGTPCRSDTHLGFSDRSPGSMKRGGAEIRGGESHEVFVDHTKVQTSCTCDAVAELEALLSCFPSHVVAKITHHKPRGQRLAAYAFAWIHIVANDIRLGNMIGQWSSRPSFLHACLPELEWKALQCN